MNSKVCSACGCNITSPDQLVTVVAKSSGFTNYDELGYGKKRSRVLCINCYRQLDTICELCSRVSSEPIPTMSAFNDHVVITACDSSPVMSLNTTMAESQPQPQMQASDEPLDWEAEQ